MRVCRLLLLASLLAAPVLAQSSSTPAVSLDDQDSLTPAQQADRDRLLQPGVDQLKAGHPADALAAFGPALTKYPGDLQVLRLAAEAALLSRQSSTAVDLFSRALATHPAQPWPLRLGRMQAYAQLGRWDEFNQSLEELRTAKTSGTDQQLANSTGFLIDQFTANGEAVQVVFFPTMASQYHTLYRFLLPKDTANKTGTKAGVNTGTAASPCQEANFQPYLDLESDDVDQAMYQKTHPDLAAKGGREFSLDTYPAPCSQGLVRFYDGEPRYETLRADLIKMLAKGTPAQ